MATIAFAFGSIGDILAVAGLARDLIRALSDSRASPGAYLELVIELDSLYSVLDNLVECMQEWQDGSNAPKLRIARSTENAILVTVRECQRLINDFLLRIESYKTSVRKSAASGPMVKVREVARKMFWLFFTEREVAELRRRLAEHRSAIHLLMTLSTRAAINQVGLDQVMQSGSHFVALRSTTTRIENNLQSQAETLSSLVLKFEQPAPRLASSSQISVYQHGIEEPMLAIPGNFTGDMAILKDVISTYIYHAFWKNGDENHYFRGTYIFNKPDLGICEFSETATNVPDPTMLPKLHMRATFCLIKAIGFESTCPACLVESEAFYAAKERDTILCPTCKNMYYVHPHVSQRPSPESLSRGIYYVNIDTHALAYASKPKGWELETYFPPEYSINRFRGCQVEGSREEAMEKGFRETTPPRLRIVEPLLNDYAKSLALKPTVFKPWE